MLERRLQLFRSQLGYAHPMQVEIRTVPGAVPPNAPNRVRPPKEVAALEKMADDLYNQDIIEPANRSPFNALPMIVWKPDGSLRPVVDWRSLNLISEKDTYPLPNVDANLAALGKADWFTTIDLLQGFLQCELTDESKTKTAFTIGNKQWQYKRMPMGLTSSPSSFMRMVDAALRGLPAGWSFAVGAPRSGHGCSAVLHRLAGAARGWLAGGVTPPCSSRHLPRRRLPNG